MIITLLLLSLLAFLAYRYLSGRESFVDSDKVYEAIQWVMKNKKGINDFRSRVGDPDFDAKLYFDFRIKNIAGTLTPEYIRSNM